VAARADSIRKSNLRATAQDVAECFAEHGLLTYASAIAFRTLVALVPLTLLGLALLGVFGLEDVWKDTIAPALKGHLTQPVFNGIDFTATQIFTTDTWSLIALSIALVIWDMTWAVNVVTQALNRIHDVEERRSKPRRAAVAAGLGLAVVLCLIAAVLVQSVAPSVTDGPLPLGGRDTALPLRARGKAGFPLGKRRLVSRHRYVARRLGALPRVGHRGGGLQDRDGKPDRLPLAHGVRPRLVDDLPHWRAAGRARSQEEPPLVS
jgi:hypothetical protein